MQTKEYESRETKLKSMHESMLMAVRGAESGEKPRRGNQSISSSNDYLREEYEEKLAQKATSI